MQRLGALFTYLDNYIFYLDVSFQMYFSYKTLLQMYSFKKSVLITPRRNVCVQCLHVHMENDLLDKVCPFCE